MVNASLPCQPDPEQRHLNQPGLSQALLAELPNEPSNGRNPGEFAIVVRPTNPLQVAGWCVPPHRPSLGAARARIPTVAWTRRTSG
jgi:hypothetical protein